MAKVSGSEIVSRVKKKQAEGEKANITFRLKSVLLERFRKRCEDAGVSMTSVLEELIAEFLK